SPLAFDPARPVINNFTVRNSTDAAGANGTRVSVNASASQSTLAQIMVTGPAGYSRDLLAQGRWSNIFNAYVLEEQGSPAPGLYTVTVTDANGKSAVRYKYLGAARPVAPVDFRSFHADKEPNGDLRILWAPVASDLPLWYQVEVYGQSDQNGDGLVDRVYSPYIMKDTNGDGILDQVTLFQQAS